MHCDRLAQGLEHWSCKPGVEGLIPGGRKFVLTFSYYRSKCVKINLVKIIKNRCFVFSKALFRTKYFQKTYFRSKCVKKIICKSCYTRFLKTDNHVVYNRNHVVYFSSNPVISFLMKRTKFGTHISNSLEVMISNSLHLFEF